MDAGGIEGKQLIQDLTAALETEFKTTEARPGQPRRLKRHTTFSFWNETSLLCASVCCVFGKFTRELGDGQQDFGKDNELQQKTARICNWTECHAHLDPSTEIWFGWTVISVFAVLFKTANPKGNASRSRNSLLFRVSLVCVFLQAAY